MDCGRGDIEKKFGTKLLGMGGGGGGGGTLPQAPMTHFKWHWQCNEPSS